MTKFWIAVAVLLFAIAAAAQTSLNVPIVVTHGQVVLTTSTYVNTSGSTVPTGTPLLMAQGFRRGDVNVSSNCAIPRNASTHNPLIWQHDNTATRHVNGDDGSVRHESFGVLTDAPVAAGAFYTIEWVSTGAACPAQTAHLHFTNITNQDLTARGSGSMTFDVNAAASNTGRDAPAKYATGPVYDGWRIAGAPTYDAASSGRLIGAQLSPTQITQSNWTGVTAGSFHVVVDGTAHDVTGINLSATTTLAAVATAINARLTAAGVGASISWIPTDEISHFELFSNSTGTSSTVSLLTAATSGTDISAQLLMTSGAVAYNSTLNAYAVAGAAAGAQDPLLYVICYVDATTQADGVTPGKVRNVCGVHNGWLSVAAGTSGRGSGPAGYAHDPQTINYRAALLDGTNTILDMSAPFDATIDTTAVPMYIGPKSASTTGCPGSPAVPAPGGTDISTQDCIPSAWIIPASTGTTPWIRGMAHVFNTTGTPPHCYWGAGLHDYIQPGSPSCQFSNGHLYFDFPAGTSGGNGFPSTYVDFTDIQGTGQSAIATPTDQGTGIVTWSSRLAHTKWFSWYTIDPSTREPWSDGTSVSFSPWQPAFDQASFSGERLYWEESSVVPPIRLSQSTPNVTYAFQNDGNYYYSPLGRGPLIGGNGVGDRPELDILNQFASQAWLKEDPTSWLYARSLTLSNGAYPLSDLLNEATGRIPALNNGPPVPPGGGAGGSYGLMGAALQDGTHDFGLYGIPPVNLAQDNFGVAIPLAGAPINLTWGDQGQPLWREATYGVAWWEGGGGTCCYPDHEPEFEGLTYSVWGPEWALDRMYLHAARVSEVESQQLLAGGSGHLYQNTITAFDQVRGGWWKARTIGNCAAFGDDSRDEQHWCNDVLTENYWAYLDWLAWADGSTPGAFEASITPPGTTTTASTFVGVYGAVSSAQNWMRLHDPYSQKLVTQFTRLFQAACGHSVADFPAYPPAYYCTTYIAQPAIANGSIPIGSAGWPGIKNMGAAYNTTNGQDYGSAELGFGFTAGSGQVSIDYNPPDGNTSIVAGDLLKDYTISYYGGGGALKIDQFDPTRQYVVMGPVNTTALTFYIQCTAADHAAYPTQCPVAGQAFTGFTSGGTPITTSIYALILHSQYDNGWTYNGDYIGFVMEAIGELSAAGSNMSAAVAQGLARFGIVNNGSSPTRQMDPAVVVP
jgi:hypothetical protein